MSTLIFSDLKRKTIRAPSNPLDKSTVISIYPKHIIEVKHTIQPGRFEIQPGSYESPSLLVVGPSSWWKEVDENQPMLEIPHSSIQIADSIVRDYCNGILGSNMGDAMPGLFYIPGEWTLAKIFMEKKQELDAAQAKQLKWFSVLIQMADSLWANSNGNPRVIGEDMRIAARHLNLHSKEWLKDIEAVELARCKACGALKNPAYPVCPNCKAIDDPDKAKALGLQFAS